MNDPFSAGLSNDGADGPLGYAPSGWQHLAMFGANLAAAANARTGSGHLAYGSGFAGPFGAAVGDTMQQAQKQALAGSQIATQRLQNINQNYQNQLLGAQLPTEVLRSHIQQRALSDPNFLSSLQGMIGGGSSFSAPAFNGAPGDLSGTVHQLESGGSMAPGITGDGGQAAGPMQVHQAALDDVNKAYGTNYTFQQMRDDPNVGKAVGDRYLQMQVQRFGPTMGLAAYNAGPGRVSQAVQSGQGMAGVPASTQGYVQRGMGAAGRSGGVDVAGPGAPAGGQSPMPAGVPQAPGQAVQPQAYFDMAGQYEQRAAQLERSQAAAKAMGGFTGVPVVGPAGDPAMLRTAAQQYRQKALELQTAAPISGAQAEAKNQSDLRYAGPTAAAKASNSNVDIRQGGMAGLVGPDGQRQWIKNPQLEKQQLPDGTTVYTHVAPPLPGSPPGTPGESTPVETSPGQPAVAALPHNVQAARDQAYKDFAGKDTDGFVAAQNTHTWLTQMDHSADVMNAHGGFLGTGPTAPERLAVANNVNDIFRTMGLPEPFDSKTVASWEELRKATTTAGFELSSHYEGHARQAAATIQNATSAVPGEKNSPIGYQTVSAGIREGAQQAIDMHQYKQQVYDHGGDLNKAETDFYKGNSPQAYARRAISTVTPYEIKSPDQAAAMKEMTRYLPGTYIKLPNGKITQVPEREGAPQVPDYLKPQQAQGG